MGETAADTREEIASTRRELSTTLAALRTRTVVVRGRVIRVAAIAGGALGLAGIGVVTVVVIRRRGGPIARAAKHLPDVTHDAVLPIARSSDRWFTRRAEAARNRRQQLIEEISAQIAANQAQAQRRANPLWRRAAGTALETAASVGVAALVRRAVSRPPSRLSNDNAQGTERETDLVGTSPTDADTQSQSVTAGSAPSSAA
jgi:hypothetical protein